MRVNKLPVHRERVGAVPDLISGIPAEWKGRFYYDSANAEVCFVGWMKEVDKVALKALEVASPSASTPSFASAIDNLFSDSENYSASSAESALVVSSGGLTIEKLLLETDNLEARCGLVLEKLLPEWRKQKLHAKLSSTLSQSLEITPETAEALLGLLCLAVPPVPPATTPPSFETLVTDARLLASDPATKPSRAAFGQAFDAAARLLILGKLVVQQKMEAVQVPWLGGVWTGLNLTDLPTQREAVSPNWSALSALASLITLRGKAAVGVSGLQKILVATPSTPTSIAFAPLAVALGCSEDTLRVFAGADGFNMSAPTWFRIPSQLLRLVNCLELILKLNMPAGLFVKLKPSRAPADAEAEVQALRQMALGQSTGSTWTDAERKVLDGIRQRRRDAAVDYLVQKHGVLDANDLYGHYLIDPQMNPCMMTSRIKQAISSVQLFIQRCFMNLEPDASPNAINKQHWEWMKNYRMWEANRKVLLYPENWIEPELRDDKTALFETVISSIQQGDFSEQNAELALRGYLNGLIEIAALEFVGFHREVREDKSETLHFVARTRNDPKKYFYRTFKPYFSGSFTGIWSGWEKIEIDIDGEHIIPVVWKGRVFIVWAIFEEYAEQTIPEKDNPTLPIKNWQIKYAWTSRENSKWKPRLLTGVLRSSWSTHTSQRWFGIRSASEESSFHVWLYAPVGGGYEPLCIAEFNGKEAKVRQPGAPFPQLLAPFDFDANASRVALRINNSALELSIYKRGSRFQIFGNAVGSASLLFPNNYPDGLGGAPRSASLTTKNAYLVYSDEGSQYLINARFAVNVHTDSPQSLVWWDFMEVDHKHAYRMLSTLEKKGLEPFFSMSLSREAAWPDGYEGEFYRRIPNQNILGQGPLEGVSFGSWESASANNWEMIFHVPFSIACNLSKNQRFEEARRWFHYIFDPTDNSSDTSSNRYWRFRPFRDAGQGMRIDELARRLADPTDSSPEKTDFQTLIAMWKDQPFQPHLVARMRIRSYMYTVVMKYLDNLIAWGDQLFRRETLEALNEATQLYILAAQILGRRPEGIPRRTRPVLKSFSELFSSQRDDLDELSNALVEAENLIPGTPGGGSAQTQGNLKSLYFCVPNNPKLLEYYDRVEDRLFKLRNCMSIEGVVRHLPLFEPAIDPSLLVRAAAAGVDVSAVLADLNAPLPFYRFNVMAQKATELCSEVKSLGAALLSAIEKGDAETMALMRSTHELRMLQSVRMVKELQLYEAKANIDAIGVSLESAQKRFTHYIGLVSQMESLSIPMTPVGVTIQSLAIAALEPLTTAASFMQSSVATVNPIVADSMEKMKQSLARTAEALSATLPPESAATEKVPMNPAEKRQLSELKSAHDLQKKAMDQRLVAQVLAKIPDFTLGAQGWTSSPVIQLTLGGTLLSSFANFSASILDTEASEHSYRAGLHSTLAGYQRRAADWLLQAELAAKEIEQITKQIAASNLRIAIASQELRNHDMQAENAHAVDEFMHSKYSNRELYNWMSGQLSNLHFQSYQLAYDVAKRSERCFKHELGVDSSFIKFGYWDNLKKGLLAGENLLSDIKRMEVAYLNQNARELEITKHVSLRQLNPQALLDLRRTGRCEFSIPERLFDLDFPGHYFRRIKSVSVSVPCVVGPYVGVTGTLRLMTSKLRDKAVISAPYQNDANYQVSYLPAQAIATSSGQNDSGLFELNFRDERYLPFEGAGAISNWEFELPSGIKAFDYDTISDLILHVRYTARDGGQTLADKAHAGLVGELTSAAGSHLVQLISVRHDFPQQWAAYRAAGSDSSLQLKLSDEYFPYLFRTRVQVEPSTITYYSDSGQIMGVTTTTATAEPKTITVNGLARSLQNAYLLVPYTLNP